MRETRNIEYKEKLTDTFLKTVSAFSNYGGGSIYFGINDRGEEIGVDNPEKLCLDIENKINDSIDPNPLYSLSINEQTGVVLLSVKEGIFKPYFYKSKAYKRNDSATIEVDRLELARLILEGQNMSFEEIKSRKKELTFDYLGKKLNEQLGIKDITQDVLKTLALIDDESNYNNAALLLSDENSFPGIDIVSFGDSISIILNRETIENESILKMYEDVVDIYHKNYQYEEISGVLRLKKELIPEKAYREAVANAIVHRMWDVNARINIEMYKDRIEITSPGGLPKGISVDDYLRGGISIPRNPIIGYVFLRLKMIERLGTGIRRINESYAESASKPSYIISDETIKIILPVLTDGSELTKDERAIISVIKNRTASSSEIVAQTGFGKTKVVAILNELVERGYVEKVGVGRGTEYRA